PSPHATLFRSRDAQTRRALDQAHLGAFVAAHTDAARSTAEVTVLTTSEGLPTSDAFRGVLWQDGREIPITGLHDLPPAGDGFGDWRIGAVDLYLGQSTAEKWEVVSLSHASDVQDLIRAWGRAQESMDGGTTWDDGTWLGSTAYNADEIVGVGRDYMPAGPRWWQGEGHHRFQDGTQTWIFGTNTNILYSNVGNAECKPSNL